VIDSDGFRPNVGIIITNDSGQVLWAQRSGQTSWQFPQGGIDGDESPREALYRELYEEVGLREEDVDIIGETRGWLRYRLPRRLIRHGQKPLCIGQKQKWFLLRLTASESAIDLSAYGKPEFDSWRWVSYWYPLRMVVNFKREVYRRAMDELLPLLHRSLRKD
jgi:putative (di)nucleoside polyphosphate hydrolase